MHDRYRLCFLISVFVWWVGVGLTSGFAQVECFFKAPSSQELTRQQARILQLKAGFVLSNSSGTTYVPIRFHLVRNNDGTGGFDGTQLAALISRLNRIYEPSNISFYLKGTTPNYINDSRYTNLNVLDEDDLANPNDASDALNIYVLQSITYSNLSVAGYAYYPSPYAFTNRVFVIANSLMTSATLPHEIGHYFNLYHTFQDNNSPVASERELVTRGAGANCSTTGDLICDTPADPYGLANTSFSNCRYTGTARDANNEPFNPLIDNIMSYYGACRLNLTTGQFDRVRNGLTLRQDPGNEYTLTASGVVSATPTCPQLTVTARGVQVSFTYSGTDAAGFLIERATNPNGPFSSIAGIKSTENTYLDGSPVPSTINYYRIKAANSALQYSSVCSVSVGLLYCIPTYSADAGTFPAQIADFRITGTTLSTNTGILPADRYNDYTTPAHLVTPGQMYSFLLNTVPGGSGTYAMQLATIWLDVNRDGLFSNAEILFQSQANQAFGPSLMGLMTIPASLSGQAGTFRMRVRTQFASDGVVDSPCNLYRYGETEDYNLKVIPCPTLTTTQSITAVRCVGEANGAVQVQATAGTTPFAYRLGTVTNTTGSFTGLLAGVYSLTVSDAEGCSTVSSLTMTNPAALTAGVTGGTTFCTGQSVTLTATGGTAFRWNTGATTAQVSLSTTGIYSLTVQNTAGCSATTTTSISGTPCSFTVQARMWFEGLYSTATGQMTVQRAMSNLLPKQQPFTAAPWSHSGTEQVTTYPTDATDWVLLVLRDANNAVLSKQALFVRRDGYLMTLTGNTQLSIPASVSGIYASFHHLAHMAVITTNPLTPGTVLDLTTDPGLVRGSVPLKLLSTGQYSLYAGDYDGSGIINNLDYNRWKVNGATVNRYLAVDGDGSGVVNNLDLNLWTRNRSKVGVLLPW